MIKRTIVIILLSILIFGGLFGWKFYQIGQAVKSMQLPPPAVVAVTDVKQTNWQPYLTAVGSLVAVAGVEVSNEVPGKINALHFDSGQAVRQGQLLVELDTSVDRAELKGLQAEQRLAKIKYDRSVQLIAKHFISQADYDQNQALLDEAKALVAAKKATIDKKNIYAPFAGKLGMRLVDVGRYLSAGSGIVSLQKLDPIYVDFTLPEASLSDLAIDQALELTVQAFPQKKFHGRINAIDPAIEIGTRSVKVRAILANPEQQLRPGMFATVQITASQARDVLTLPDTAITYNPYGDSVFVVNSGEKGLTVELKQVKTGETRSGRVEIVKGLNVGDRVVSAGQVKLRNGMPVTLDNKPAPGEREPAQ